MAHYEPIVATPVLGIEDGAIVLASVVAGRVTSFGKVLLHVITWEAGQGERSDYFTPAEFAEWRRSFTKPSERN